MDRIAATKPDCYRCKHKRSIPGDAHVSCDNRSIKVTGSPHGIKKGWFFWPYNFDPVWLVECNGFEAKSEKGGER